MQIELQPDIQEVAEFMQRNIPTSRLVAVAAGINGLAPLLWGHHQDEPAYPKPPLILVAAPII